MSPFAKCCLALAAGIASGLIYIAYVPYPSRSDGWSSGPRSMMLSKPPIERIQLPGEQWYELTGPPGIYECSHAQGCRLLRETGEAPK